MIKMILSLFVLSSRVFDWHFTQHCRMQQRTICRIMCPSGFVTAPSRSAVIPASMIPIPAYLFDSDSDSSHLGYDTDSNTIFLNDSDSYSIPTAALLNTLILTTDLYKFRCKYQPRCYYIIFMYNMILYNSENKTWFSLCTFMFKNLFKTILFILPDVSLSLIILT